MIGSVKTRISVVIPTRNTRDMTLAALGSLGEQTRAADEIIVVDDGSSDGTLGAVAGSFPNAIQVPISESVGFTRAVNRGVEATMGDVIWLLNSDTVVDPGAVGLLVSSFDRDPNLGIAGASLSFPDGTPQWSGGRFPTSTWLLAQASGLPALLGHVRVWRYLKPTSGTSSADADWVPGAAMAVRREMWDKVGPLREEYRLYCQDLDICWCAKREGWKIRILPDVRVIHYHGGTIGSTRGAAGSIHANHLWSDFVRFFAIHHGADAGRRVARLIKIGGKLRIWSRRAATPFVVQSRRGRWRKDTNSYLSAIQGVSRTVSSLE
jgi:GT2 family glycosyltransferase